MDRKEARQLLAAEVERLRGLSYEQLASRIPRVRKRILFIDQIDEPQVETQEVVGASGAGYQVETQVFWDGRPDDNIRVLVAIDDGGLSAFKPMSDDFIMASDGGFVGE